MKKEGGFLILSAIGLDSVIHYALISFFYPEIINVSNHSSTQTPIWKDHREIIRPYRRFPACWHVVATDGADGGNRHRTTSPSAPKGCSIRGAKSSTAERWNQAGTCRKHNFIDENWGCKNNRRFRQPAPFGRPSESSVSTKFPNNIRYFLSMETRKTAVVNQILESDMFGIMACRI